MGYWYWRALKKALVLDENATNKFDLPERGMLSGFAIHSQGVNEADLSAYDRPFPVQRHTKFRIVANGNVEIINAKGSQLQALDCWNRNANPSGKYSQVDTHYQRNYFFLPFGRFLGDLKMGLDLGKFAVGVEFEETNDYSTTYHVDGSQTLDVYGLFRKSPEAGLFAEGYLKKRQIIDVDAATRTQEAVKLPTDLKLRQISLFTEGDIASGVETGNPLSTAKTLWLRVKSKEENIFANVRSREFAIWMHDIMGRKFRTEVSIMGGTGGLAYLDPMMMRCDLVSGIAHSPAQSDDDVMTLGGDTRIKKCYTNKAGTGTAAVMAQCVCKGIGLHGHIPLLLQDPLSESDTWLDAKEQADVYVEVTEGHSTGRWQIVLDELEKNYPA